MMADEIRSMLPNENYRNGWEETFGGDGKVVPVKSGSQRTSMTIGEKGPSGAPGNPTGPDPVSDAYRYGFDRTFGHG